MAMAHKNDYCSLFQIIQLCTKHGNDNTAWPIIEENLNITPFTFRHISDNASLSFNCIAKGFQESRAYDKFRKDFSVTKYFVEMRGKGLEPDPKIGHALEISLMVPFGVILQTLRTLKNREESDELRAAFSINIMAIAKIISYFGVSWIAQSKPKSSTMVSELLARAIIYIREIIAIESSNQLGYCLGILGVSQDITKSTEHIDWGKISSDITILFLHAIQNEWHVFKN